MNPEGHKDADKYQQAWQAEAARTRVTIDAELLSKEVQRSHEVFRSTIFWRDIGEVAVGLLLLPFWFFMGATLSLPWTWYLIVPALIWSVGFALVDRRRHPQRPSEPGEPLLHNVKESLSQVEHQIWLLRNVFWWYLLPFSIAIMAFFFHVAWQSSSAWWEFAAFSSVLSLFVIVIYGWIYRLNQRAVREQLEPRRQDLLKLIASLEGETASEESQDVLGLVSGLGDPMVNCSWAENWNRMIPSWRVATIITLATLGGALCGYLCGRWAPIDEMFPLLFWVVVGAVIPFEIALGCAWLRSRKNHGPSPSASTVDTENAANQEPRLLPKAPAILIIVLTLLVGIMAFVVVFQVAGGAGLPRGPGLDDVSAFNESDIAHTDAWLQKFVDDFYPSLSAVVVRDGEIVYLGAFGFEDIKAGREATTQTQYHVASVTKVFTASLAAILHERGVVDLDAPVVKYLPEDVSISTMPEVGATITLRQLASHTSGLPRGVPGQVQSVEGWYQLEPRRLYEHLANVKLNSEPGAAEEYSNLGFGLLGHALERAAGEPFDRLMQELVCGPLKLERTAIQADDKLRPATGYGRGGSRSGGQPVERQHSFKERLAASGGLVTSVEDLARFLIAQMKPGVFSHEMLDELHTETKLSDGSASGTALGWSVRRIDDVGRVLEKNGGRSNCSAWIGFSPEYGVGVAIVTNCGGPDVDPIGRKLLERSIPLSRKKLVAEDGYAKVAPYTGVRWENDRPIVRVQEEWYPLDSIDGIPNDRILEFARQEFGDKARKRFAEDLVELLTTMGHEPDWKVTLGLQTEDGQVERRQILMTEHNRDLVRE